MVPLFALTLFLNALLLFWVQPLFGKAVLPLLGGSPSVWTTCMLFFQAALLAGYAYSHLAVRILGVRRQALLHAVVIWLPLFILPVDIATAGSPLDGVAPVGWLLGAMAWTIGFPFVVIAATAPLLQRWFWSTGHPAAGDPYFLYAASNAGSLIALLAFPVLLEPLLPVGSQHVLWKGTYALVAMLLTACALVVVSNTRSSNEIAHANSDADSATQASDSRDERLRNAPSVRQRFRWLLLSFVPSSLMLGVTTYLSTDVAAVPLIWIVPLGLYLLTFIIAFASGGNGIQTAATRAVPLTVLPLMVLLLSEMQPQLWFGVPLHLLAFGALAMQCHGALARSRPGGAHLTEFYLWLAMGGVAGGVFNTIVAPQVFTTVIEYPLVLALGCLATAPLRDIRAAATEIRLLRRPLLATAAAAAILVAASRLSLEGQVTAAALGIVALVPFSISRQQARFGLSVAGMLGAMAIGSLAAPPGGSRPLYTERTFFGVYRVTVDSTGRFVTLVHGTTVHGRQAHGDVRPEPLSYYHRNSPIGDLLAARGERTGSVGVVGLGVGALAAYATPGSRWVFYEIDPAVERIARDTRYFTYLDRCEARCSVVLGDARLVLAGSKVAHDVLVLDAFSSDAIPVHLMTSEAMQVYEGSLGRGGVMAFHISNRHIDLRPVLVRLARDRGWSALGRLDVSADQNAGFDRSDWMVLARSMDDVGALAADKRWTPLEADDGPAWSDDFSNIWTALRWR